MARLRVGQAYTVFYRPGFGLAVPAPTSLSTQPPFATQALNYGKYKHQDKDEDDESRLRTLYWQLN